MSMQFSQAFNDVIREKRIDKDLLMETIRNMARIYPQIYYKIKPMAGFDLGTQYTLATECGLGRRNIQFPEIISLYSKS